MPFTCVSSRSMRQRWPLPPQPALDSHWNSERPATRASRNRPSPSAGPDATSCGRSRRVSSAMPKAPIAPGCGGTTTSPPVLRATAAASASEANGMPWQNTTAPTGRWPLTRFR